MRRFQLASLMALACLVPSMAHAQNKQAEKKIGVILEEFDLELRGYERELKHFDRVPGSKPLMDLRMQLVEQSNEMKRLDVAGKRTGPAVLNLAREMDRNARDLDAGTTAFEKRAEAVAGANDKAVAGRMKGHADMMVKSIDKVITMFR